jgi:predicted phage terminase large subunit-like protein
MTAEVDTKQVARVFPSRAAQLAREDFYFFVRWMFLRMRGSHWRQAPHHQLICDALMRVFRGECRRIIFNLPPRYSKTELVVVMFIAWCLGKAPDSEFIHASYAGTLASANSGKVLQVIQHEAYAEVFPEVELANDAKSHWRTTDGGQVFTTGTGGSMTGFGAGKDRPGFGGAIILDDPHKADEAKSKPIREGVIDWFQNTVESRGNAAGRATPIIVVMQRLHQLDLAGWLLDGGNGEEWELVCLPALQEDGTALWPEKHTAEQLRSMQRAAPYHFSGQYQQRPSPAEGGFFKPDQLVPVKAVPAGIPIRWARGWDLGATTTGDWTAGVKLGALADGRFIIAHVNRLREAPDERDAALRNTAAADGRQVKVSLPQDPGQAGKTQILHLTRMLAGYPVHTSPESGDKETRAEPIASQINVGNCMILIGPWNQEFTDELRAFPNGAFDDQVDGLSRAAEALMVAPVRIEGVSPKGL